jgi:hypothetical protein
MMCAMSSTNSHGIYYLDDDLNTDALCWIKNRDQVGFISPRPWAFLLIPLFICYSYAIYVSHCAREMLDPTSPNSKHSGLLKTHFHRLFALDSNTRTIKIYVGYWLFLLLSAFLVFFSVNSSHFGTHSKLVSTSFMNLVLLSFGAKGYVDLIVFSSILLSRSYKVCATSNPDSPDGDTTDYFHLNKGLKLQLMTFVTSGLKQSNEEILLCEGQDSSTGDDNGINGSSSRMWTIKVKSHSERATADLDLIGGGSGIDGGVLLTNQQYRKYLEEVNPVIVEAIVSGDRLSVARYSTDSSRSTIAARHSSSRLSRSRGGGDALLDAEMEMEIPQRKTINDQQPELSQTVATVREDGNIFRRFLRSTGLFLHENSHEAVFEEFLPEIFADIRQNSNIQHIYREYSLPFSCPTLLPSSLSPLLLSPAPPSPLPLLFSAQCVRWN